MNTATNHIYDHVNDWGDTKIININTIGTYPKPKHHPKTKKGLYDPRLMRQHKPYGIASPNPDPFDDRPDWFKFKAKPKKQYYEDITPHDEEFQDAMIEDHQMHISHHHKHIKPIEPDTHDEEIGDTIEL